MKDGKVIWEFFENSIKNDGILNEFPEYPKNEKTEKKPM